jgi:hypothetical protein
METPGQVAYEAYRAAAGGRSLAAGDPLPEFEDLPAAIRRAWEAVADAVCRRHGAIY